MAVDGGSHLFECPVGVSKNYHNPGENSGKSGPVFMILRFSFGGLGFRTQGLRCLCLFAGSMFCVADREMTKQSSEQFLWERN